MDDFLIRDAVEDDVKPLTDLDRICFDLPWSEVSFFEEITRNGIARYVVAEVAGEIAGYAGIWLIHEEGHITNIAVHPDFRRQGIAKALISELFAMSEGCGVKTYTLEVRASSESAISLYKNMGFKKCGVRKKYYENNSEDAIIMWKT